MGRSCTKEAFGRARTPFSNPLCPCRLRPASRRGGGRTGKTEVDGSDPPFLPPGAAKRCRLMCTARAIAWGGRSRPNYPWREGQEEERGPVGPVPPDPPVAPEPLAAHIAASEPDARRGWASPPEPPGCEETHTNQRSFQRGTGLRLDDLTPLWKIRDFPQGASFCLQFSFATDLPSPQPHPCHLLSPLDRQNRGSLATMARTPSLTLR